MQAPKITDDLDALMGVLPSEISEAILEENDSSNLLEVVLDLGRAPTARFLKGEAVLLEKEISREAIDFVGSKVSQFDDDNRAGLERTLHRISAIRNRRGDIVGLTCRVGRAVYGTTEIIKAIRLAHLLDVKQVITTELEPKTDFGHNLSRDHSLIAISEAGEA